ncbi:GerW family sporulation protein [Amphibacillus sp. MSJ-3]|uniref:GerW family sporulation protein n=1 Tax=Amphibacillus sp. MSJ-3 TaxID=2841505 RepID=UPI001C0EB2A4|nr:GerW family sporulation protein [Amphibacillus sp. MSJ-3]MBU5593676.1 GerW family sporulation protein [Amphibacillus sp. MSJ-3]
MQQHPIEGLMSETMEQLKHIIDVKTIIGDPIQTPDGSTIIPISKVGFGFAAGGSEFSNQKKSEQEQDSEEASLPFGGGSGGGVSITPIAFLITNKQGNEIVHLHDKNHFYEKLVDVAPQAVEKIKEILEEKKSEQDK